MTNEERKYAIEVFENANKCFEQKKKFNCDCNCDKCSASRAYFPKELKKAVDTALEALKQEPREHGEWIQEEYWSEGCGMGESYGHWYGCSKCSNRVKDGYKKCGLDFCSNCGADMRRRKNNV